MKNLIKNNWLSLLIIAAVLVWGILQLSSLPDQIPIHFDSAGNANQYSSKYFSVFFIPLMNLFVVLSVSGILKISPRKYSAQNSQTALSMLNTAVTLFFSVLYFAMIKEATEPNQWMYRALPIGLSLLTLVMGNYFGKIEKNFVVGFRIPWTLASDENWKQTHRFAGKAYVTAGVVSLVISFIYPSLFISVGALLLATLSGVIYSYRYFVKNEEFR